LARVGLQRVICQWSWQCGKETAVSLRRWTTPRASLSSPAA
jgi:hypothetical protein